MFPLRRILTLRMNEYQKLRDAVHLLLCLFVPFCISSAAFGMGDSFLILRGGGEIWGGLACALVFSCLFVFLLFGGIKLLRGQKPQLIRLRGIAFALLAGVLAAPLVIAAQEYLFMRKVLCISKDHSPGTVIREPEQIDYLEARWWPCGGYTLRCRKLQGDVWRFDVPD